MEKSKQKERKQMTNKSVDELKDEFVRTFADEGVFLTPEDINIIFNIYTQKANNILNQIEQENTK